jgi:hypothetical protein
MEKSPPLCFRRSSAAGVAAAASCLFGMWLVSRFTGFRGSGDASGFDAFFTSASCGIRGSSCCFCSNASSCFRRVSFFFQYFLTIESSWVVYMSPISPERSPVCFGLLRC